MSDKIFSDVDLNVRVERNPEIFDPRSKSKYVYQGVVYTIACQDCEVPMKIGLTWKEIKHLLDGGQLPNVVRVSDGWQISAKCGNSEEGCERKNTFSVTDAELENEANLEISRRQRVMRAQQGGQPGAIRR